MKHTTLFSTLAAAIALGLASQPATALEKGDLLLRFGLANVSPNDGSSGGAGDNDAVGVEDDTQPFINVTWMLSDNLGLDVLGATPFTHDITLEGSGKIAETEQLPPTVGLQYHFTPQSNVRPYVGAGINYTTFFNEKATAVIDSISLDDSWGLAAQAGVDVDINRDWFFNADLRYMQIDTTAKTNLAEDIDVDIDPWVISLGVGMTF
ncbi:OmpW/AlkL family protein [Thiohalophilus thiocyanatoxydans]|uniref:Outer membrane protein n=1 Tax=Thiohalophilus thiocyanatoxydans TaxID=381308 RepID=A0A4R8J172_9GAMM|nr:OmpW family outer membrane protein [Thiohalophilus thiocyanatoxydans]TDY04057.1 outer membrane protein [Thiohalophilus thiocyanatoxydans]